MPTEIRAVLIAISFAFLPVALYYRVQSQRTEERLDRTKEGWPILIGVRVFGFLTFGSIFLWLFKPDRFAWASQPIGIAWRWMGVAGFACSVAWLMWMFGTLGRNLTDTVVTRKNACFVDNGPYRFVRNPMYTGILMAGWSLGVALGTWLVPLAATGMFAMLAVRTRTEEKYLLERFGDEYSAYMRRVGRFFPR